MSVFIYAAKPFQRSTAVHNSRYCIFWATQVALRLNDNGITVSMLSSIIEFPQTFRV